jgi:hypothetical protein
LSRPCEAGESTPGTDPEVLKDSRPRRGYRECKEASLIASARYPHLVYTSSSAPLERPSVFELPPNNAPNPIQLTLGVHLDSLPLLCLPFTLITSTTRQRWDNPYHTRYLSVYVNIMPAPTSLDDRGWREAGEYWLDSVVHRPLTLPLLPPPLLGVLRVPVTESHSHSCLGCGIGLVGTRALVSFYKFVGVNGSS